MSILYLRYPSRVSAESALENLEPVCRFAWTADNGNILQQGMVSLSQLAATIAQAKQIIVLVAASDVTLLRMKVPKLSAAKMRTALPNLVEDRLISDPAESVIVAGAPGAEGVRRLAVVQRAWLERMARSLQSLGARKIAAIPLQLCLPEDQAKAYASAEMHAGNLELAMRMPQDEGIGLPIATNADESPAMSAVHAIRVLAPDIPVTLWAPESEANAYRDAADESMTVETDDWAVWIRGAGTSGLDLMSGVPGFGSPAFEWKRWRWLMALAAAIVIVNLAGLYFSWWQLKREADALRTSMIETYRSVFPQESVIVDPVAQMNQKLAAARRNAGQVADDDFTALAATLGETLNRIASQGQGAPAIAALEYRDRSLMVRWKGEAPRLEDARAALAARNFAVTQTGTGMWQIRSAK